MDGDCHIGRRITRSLRGTNRYRGDYLAENLTDAQAAHDSPQRGKPCLIDGGQFDTATGFRGHPAADVIRVVTERSGIAERSAMRYPADELDSRSAGGARLRRGTTVNPDHGFPSEARACAWHQ